MPIDFYDSSSLKREFLFLLLNLFSHLMQRNFSVAFVISIKEKNKNENRNRKRSLCQQRIMASKTRRARSQFCFICPYVCYQMQFPFASLFFHLWCFKSNHRILLHLYLHFITRQEKLWLRCDGWFRLLQFGLICRRKICVFVFEVHSYIKHTPIAFSATKLMNSSKQKWRSRLSQCLFHCKVGMIFSFFFNSKLRSNQRPTNGILSEPFST